MLEIKALIVDALVLYRDTINNGCTKIFGKIDPKQVLNKNKSRELIVQIIRKSYEKLFSDFDTFTRKLTRKEIKTIGNYEALVCILTMIVERLAEAMRYRVELYCLEGFDKVKDNFMPTDVCFIVKSAADNVCRDLSTTAYNLISEQIAIAK